MFVCAPHKYLVYSKGYMEADLEIALLVLEKLENQTTHTRITRGYGVAHPHFGGEGPRTLGNRTNLGNSRYEYEDDDDNDEKPEDTQKVKVSRAFK